MIDERILKSTSSTFDDPSFSVLINNFSQNNECNKDEIIIALEQVTPNLYKLIQTKEYIIDQLISLLKTNNITIPNDITERNKEHINTIVEKQIILDSNIVLNDDKTFKSVIEGYVDIIGYGNTPIQQIDGRIKNRIVNIIQKGYPVYIPVDRIRVRNDCLYVTVPNDIKDVVVKIDNETITTTKENNIISAPCEGIQNGEHTFNISYIIKEDITNQNIEVVVTPIQKEINIEFTNPHEKIPSIILTVDKKDTNLYSTYNTAFIMNEEQNVYTGVKITFNNLRRKLSYPDINICILGE